MNDVEQAQAALASAEAELSKASGAVEAQHREIEAAEAELADLDVRLDSLDAGDARSLSKHATEVGAVRTRLQVLQRHAASLATAEAEAQARRDQAQRRHDELRGRADLERLRAERARREGELTELGRAHRATVEALLASLKETWEAGDLLARALGEEWRSNRWPEPDAPDLFERLAQAAAPPRSPDPAQEAHDRMVREANARMEEKFLEAVRAADREEERARAAARHLARLRGGSRTNGGR